MNDNSNNNNNNNATNFFLRLASLFSFTDDNLNVFV